MSTTTREYRRFFTRIKMPRESGQLKRGVPWERAKTHDNRIIAAGVWQSQTDGQLRASIGEVIDYSETAPVTPVPDAQVVALRDHAKNYRSSTK